MRGKILTQKVTGGTRLSVYVQPRASSDQIVDLHNDALKICITSPPLEERANRQLIQFLAQSLNLSVSRLALVKGRRSRQKTIMIKGLSEAGLSRLLTKYLV